MHSLPFKANAQSISTRAGKADEQTATTLPLNQITADNFPLPTLSTRIRKRSAELPDQCPYFMVRGLKPQCFSKYKNVTIFAGIASHVATKRAFAPGDANVLRKLEHVPHLTLAEVSPRSCHEHSHSKRTENDVPGTRKQDHCIGNMRPPRNMRS
jgi:hypothetical protein